MTTVSKGYVMKRTLLACVCTAILTTMTIGGVQHVLADGATDVYRACVSTTGVIRAGTIRLNATPNCQRATDTVASWNAAGVAGPDRKSVV